MPIKDLIEKVAAIVAGELHIPDHPRDFPHPDGPHRKSAVVNAKAILKIYGVLLFLSLY